MGFRSAVVPVLCAVRVLYALKSFILHWHMQQLSPLPFTYALYAARFTPFTIYQKIFLDYSFLQGFSYAFVI